MKLRCENCGCEKTTNEKWWKFAGDNNCGHCWQIVRGGYEENGWFVPCKFAGEHKDS